MGHTIKYAEVILPLALSDSFTYLIQEEFIPDIAIGKRVLVQFGKKKLYSGIVIEIHRRVPEGFDPKEIISVIDDCPLVEEHELQFWKWIAKYYMCTIGEVMNAALPAGLKLASETIFTWGNNLSREVPGEFAEIANYFKDESPFTLDDLRKGPYGTNAIKAARQLTEEGYLSTDQHFRRSYKAKQVSYISLGEEFKDSDSLNIFLDTLSRAPMQMQAIETFLLLGNEQNQGHENLILPREDLTRRGISSQSINSLIRKGVFHRVEKKVSRLESIYKAQKNSPLNVLTNIQKKAYNSIKEKFNSFPVVLLDGVTSSGKTELYIHLIKDTIDSGKQVLYLLPEIAITTQILERLAKVFGNELGVYHSRYSDNERVEVYLNLARESEKSSLQLIVGVRSAIYLPFRDLGLVIIDEEHEYTYKQHDPAPRYHARDAATVRAMFSGAKVLLGSATPSFESIHNTQIGKYGLVELKERYGNIALPEIIIADIARARKRKQLKAHLTPELQNAMKESLESGKQVILFQNRRGYSNYLICESCGFILKCRNCDVSLTYHKLSGDMVCHYCGFKMPLNKECPECGSGLSMRGFGTEKVEEELSDLMPGVSVSRLDIDKSRSRKGLEKVLDDFASGRTQILVGTQLVAKGLDFENVSVVGILDADAMLNFPDFRAFERSYQLMVQVSGRAGRRMERGKVILQTSDPEHPVIQQVLNHMTSDFINEQLAERKLFNYPPFSRLIRITLKHEIPSILDGGAIFLANELKEIFGNRVLGPQQAMISRVQGKYVRQILLKIEKDASIEKSKEIISELFSIFSVNPVYRQIRLNVDVDPL